MGENISMPDGPRSITSTRRRILRGAAGVGVLSGFGIGTAAGDEGAESNAGEEQWRVEFDNSDFLRGPELSPVVNETLFVSNPDGVYALSASTGDEEWKFGVDDTRFNNPPVVVDDTVFATTDDSFGREVEEGLGTAVYALDANAGEQKWQFDEFEQLSAPIHVAENTVFIPSQFCVYAVDAGTGEQRWQFKMGYGVESTGHPEPGFLAETAAGTVYLVDGDGNMFAVDVATGEEEWRVNIGNRVTTDLSLADGTLFLGAYSPSEQNAGSEHEYYVSALDAATGDERWRFTVDTSDGPEWVDPQLQFVKVIGDTLYTGSDSCGGYSPCASLYAVDVDSGEKKWKFKADNSVDRVTEADGTLFVGTAVWQGDDGIVHAVDPETGTERWSSLLGNLLLSTITVIEDTLFVVSRTDTDFEDAYQLNALDTATGDEKWTFVADNDVSNPRFADGSVFVTTERTTVHALDAGVEFANEDSRTDDNSRENNGAGNESSENTPSVDLDLSVTASDSIARGERASVDIVVQNHDEDATEVTVTFKAGNVSESTSVEIDAGDCYASYHSVWCGDLSVGNNEWTVVAGDEQESGTLIVTDE
ncbi:PQQ-binding-like beta-propeller repeat protein [Saliphagus sp. LR7]|uniref:outer membrane protein assembly factor BamB family protein n=1 Tax=Saliphagus sp. LR7 TaxID=2282654 RepID=UPI001E4688A8|nr:PQQ-binding-like beta-propeller repeat protein [Saliphagus sp. LR7]